MIILVICLFVGYLLLKVCGTHYEPMSKTTKDVVEAMIITDIIGCDKK